MTYQCRIVRFRGGPEELVAAQLAAVELGGGGGGGALVEPGRSGGGGMSGRLQCSQLRVPSTFDVPQLGHIQSADSDQAI
jgi:hypothetical protein